MSTQPADEFELVLITELRGMADDTFDNVKNAAELIDDAVANLLTEIGTMKAITSSTVVLTYAIESALASTMQDLVSDAVQKIVNIATDLGKLSHDSHTHYFPTNN